MRYSILVRILYLSNEGNHESEFKNKADIHHGHDPFFLYKFCVFYYIYYVYEYDS